MWHSASQNLNWEKEGVQGTGKRPWPLSGLSLVDEVLLGVEQRSLETQSSSGRWLSLPLGINTECGLGFQAAGRFSNASLNQIKKP